LPFQIATAAAVELLKQDPDFAFLAPDDPARFWLAIGTNREIKLVGNAHGASDPQAGAESGEIAHATVECRCATANDLPREQHAIARSFVIVSHRATFDIARQRCQPDIPVSRPTRKASSHMTDGEATKKNPGSRAAGGRSRAPRWDLRQGRLFPFHLMPFIVVGERDCGQYALLVPPVDEVEQHRSRA
jgi:hypothetical protein